MQAKSTRGQQELDQNYFQNCRIVCTYNNERKVRKPSVTSSKICIEEVIKRKFLLSKVKKYCENQYREHAPKNH